MDELYKVINDTGEAFSVKKDELPKAAKEGYLPVLGNLKKETIRVKPEEITEAEKNGYFNQREVDEYKEQNKGLEGTLKTAGGQFGNQFLFGVPQIAADNLQKPIEVAKREALKEEHPVANVLGGLGGFGSSLLIGGPLFKAAGLVGEGVARGTSELVGQAISNKLAQKAIEAGARLGAEGVVYAAPTALTEAVTGNPKAAVERIIAGGLGNIVLGGALESSGWLLNKIGKEGSAALEKQAYKTAAKDLGLTPSDVNFQGGYSTKINPEDVLATGKQALDEGIVGPLKSTIAKKEANLELMQKTGEARQKIYDMIDNAGVSEFKPFDVAKKVAETLGDFDKTSPAMSQAKNQLERSLETILGKTEKGIATDFLPINNAQKLLEELKIDAKFDTNRSNEANSLAKKVYKLVRNELNTSAEKSAERLGVSGLKDELERLNRTFNLSYNAQKLLNKKLQKEGGAYLNLNDTILGGIGLETLGPKGLLAVAAKKAFQKHGNSILAPTFKKMSDSIRSTDEFLNQISPAIMSAVNVLEPRVVSDLTGLNASKLEQINDNLEKIKQNPEAFAQHIADQADALNEIDPTATGLYSQKIQEIAGYIQNAIPKNPNNIPTPFRQTTWVPSSLELSKFNNIKNAALNPQIVIEQLSKGVLNSDSVKTVNDLYPEFSKQMDEKIIDILQKVPKLSYAKKQQLQLLMKTTYLPEYSQNSMKTLQGNLKINQQDQGQQQQNSAKPVNLPNIGTDLNKSLYQK